MASTNQHVDLINAHIQTARRDLLQIDPEHHVVVGGGELVYVGDIVATRRNHRHLITTSGEHVRNRELWTVTGTNDNGDLTLAPLTGHGRVTLPASYVAEHVRLGYAATEMGTQSDTVTAGFELASRATSCRALYVAMTRGRRDNTVCVLTDSHDLAEARDILDTIIAIDRADTPATTQRRRLATEEHQQTPRCQVPGWFDELHRTTAAQLKQARARHIESQRNQIDLGLRLAAAEQRRHAARLAAGPFDRAIDAAAIALRKAIAERRAIEKRLATARRGDRKSIRAELVTASERVEIATAGRDEAVRAAQPTTSASATTAHELTELRREEQRERLFNRWIGGPETTTILDQRIDVLDTWQQWASGADVDRKRLQQAAGALFITNDPIGKLTTLHRTMLAHPATNDLLKQAPHERALPPPSPTMSMGGLMAR